MFYSLEVQSTLKKKGTIYSLLEREFFYKEDLSIHHHLFINTSMDLRIFILDFGL